LSDLPTEENQIATVLNKFLRILVSIGDKAAEDYLTSLDPALLSLPIISNILDFGVSEIGNVIYTFMAESLTSIVIDIETNKEESSVVNASTALQLAQASGDTDAIQKAQANAVTAWSNLIRYDGSSPI
jgi:hypothetical protein